MYSELTWGTEQADTYESALHNRLQQIREYPEIGRPCPELLPGCRRLRSDHHMIYYTFASDVVIVHRILHERRHATKAMMAEQED